MGREYEMKKAGLAASAAKPAKTKTHQTCGA
jgi:hypothetical protein